MNYLQALRNCCQDEVAFEQLQQLLLDPCFTEFLLAKRQIMEGTNLPTEALKPQSEAERLALHNAELSQQVTAYAAEIQAQAAELETLRCWQGVVFDIVEHDLQTFVLGSILVMKHLLQQPGDRLTIARDRVERMAQGSDRQLTLINTLLEAHHSAVAGIRLQPDTMPFPQLIQQITPALQPLLSTYQAQLTTHLAADLPCVAVEAQQIQRVLHHLLTVVLKHNPPGLKLTLKASLQGDRLYCTLQDNGRPWEPTDCDRFFDLQVRTPRSCCSTSLSLQLHLCQQIIAAHGGQIGVISPPQEGSTYWFTLPLASAAIAPLTHRVIQQSYRVNI